MSEDARPQRYLIAFKARESEDPTDLEWIPRNDRLFTSEQADAEVERATANARWFEFKKVLFDA